MDVADNGTVFATVLHRCSSRDCRYATNADTSLGGLYVITPEAVAGAE